MLGRVPEYQNLTDDEVLQIATEREQLTDDARTVLDSELSRRKLSIKAVQSHKVAYERAQKLEQAKRDGSINRFSLDRSGIGIKFLGKWNLRRDPSGKFEEYDATRWFVVFWLPLFPIATCTVHRTLSQWIGLTFKSDPQVVARQARNWEQIMLTWVKTAAVLLSLRLAYLFLLYHPVFFGRR